jgi:hypothetical protein
VFEVSPSRLRGISAEGTQTLGCREDSGETGLKQRQKFIGLYKQNKVASIHDDYKFPVKFAYLKG